MTTVPELDVDRSAEAPSDARKPEAAASLPPTITRHTSAVPQHINAVLRGSDREPHGN